jgi:hypothetical protein
MKMSTANKLSNCAKKCLTAALALCVFVGRSILNGRWIGIGRCVALRHRISVSHRNPVTHWTSTEQRLSIAFRISIVRSVVVGACGIVVLCHASLLAQDSTASQESHSNRRISSGQSPGSVGYIPKHLRAPGRPTNAVAKASAQETVRGIPLENSLDNSSSLLPHGQDAGQGNIVGERPNSRIEPIPQSPYEYEGTDSFHVDQGPYEHTGMDSCLCGVVVPQSTMHVYHVNASTDAVRGIYVRSLIGPDTNSFMERKPFRAKRATRIL